MLARTAVASAAASAAASAVTPPHARAPVHRLRRVQDVAAKKSMKEKVWDAVGSPAAVEMENAGVAQICKAYGIPYVSLRAISDVVEGDANEDFGKFCATAAENVFPIVQHIAKTLPVPA
jgi:nucleoside phosphorylase